MIPSEQLNGVYHATGEETSPTGGSDVPNCPYEGIVGEEGKGGRLHSLVDARCHGPHGCQAVSRDAHSDPSKQAERSSTRRTMAWPKLIRCVLDFI